MSPPPPPCNIVPLYELPVINNKHPNFEWGRLEGRGTDCFDPRWTQFEDSVRQQFCPPIVVVISSGIRLCNNKIFWLQHEHLSFSKYKGQDWDKMLKIRKPKKRDMATNFLHLYPKQQGGKAKQWKVKCTKKTKQECTRLKRWISYTLPSWSLVDQNFDETGSHEFVAGAVE